jgi:Leucine-rich repeat (LRR) protein
MLELRCFSIILVLHIVQVRTQSFDNFNKLCQTGLREDNSNYIYCARKNLKQIPKFTTRLTTTTLYDELVLSENQIESIEEKSIDENFKVRKIYLDLNPIKAIHRNSFASLKNYLEEFYVDLGIYKYDKSYATIDYLNMFNQSVFDRCINLKNLSIKNFNLNSIQTAVFRKLSKLTSLTLSNCNLNVLDAKAFVGLDQALVDLNLDSNNFERIPTEAIGQLKSLKRLNMAQNRLKIFDTLIGLNNLIHLDLSFNFIRKFEIQPASNKIRSLNLKNNNLNFMEFSNILKNLVQLESLNFDFNKLNQLGTIMNANVYASLTTSVETLSLQGCGIATDLLPNFNQIKFRNLKNLNLARNKLTSITFETITSLESLTVDKNPIRLQANSFNGLEMSLKSLSLNSIDMKLNEIRYMANLKRLEYLKLSGNALNDDEERHDVDDITWPDALGFSSLVHLDLQNNNLKKLPSFICNLNNLSDLDLNANKLEYLDENCMKILLNSNLRQINLNNNPLKCDCKLKYLRDWLNVNYDPDFLELFKWECNEPSNLKSNLFTSLSPNDFVCEQIPVRQTTAKPSGLVYEIRNYVSTDRNPIQVTKSSVQDTFLSNDTYFYISVGILFGLLTVFLSIVLLVYSICSAKDFNAAKKTAKPSSKNSSSMDFNTDLYNTIDTSIELTNETILQQSPSFTNPPLYPDYYYKTFDNTCPLVHKQHDDKFDCSTEYGYYYKIPNTLERNNHLYGYAIDDMAHLHNERSNKIFSVDSNKELSYYF